MPELVDVGAHRSHALRERIGGEKGHRVIDRVGESLPGDLVADAVRVARRVRGQGSRRPEVVDLARQMEATAGDLRLEVEERLRHALLGDRAVAEEPHERSGQRATKDAITPQNALSLADIARFEMQEVVATVAGSGKPQTAW